MQHTRDDDGRRRTTTAQKCRVVVVDGRWVTLAQARPVVAKRVATQLANDVGQRDWPTSLAIKRVTAVGVLICAALAGFSAWFVPVAMVFAMAWMICLYMELS